MSQLTWIKETLEKATPNWFYNGNEIVSKQNLRCGIGGFLTEEDNLLAANAPEWLASLVSKVEEMQKALEWYADDKNYDVYEINTEEQGVIVMTEYWTNVTKDEGERARQALKGESQ